MIAAARDPVTRLLAALDAAWTDFHASIAGLSDEDLLDPGVAGSWSVRDLIAHVTWWDEEALKHLPVVLDGGRPPRYSVTYGGIDAFNSQMHQRRRALSLAEVRGLAETTHRRLVDYVSTVPADQLVSGTRFRRRLRLDTYGHYAIHTEMILAWRRHRDGR